MRAITALCLLWGLSWGLAADWPQRAGNPQRTSATKDCPQPPFRLAWLHHIDGERVHHWNQPILAEGKVFLGTLEGVMHCWPLSAEAYRANQGKDLWAFKTQGPIMQSAGYENGRLLFGSMDGHAYALNAKDGSLLWKTRVGRPGFSTAALLAEGKAFMASRRGKLYALDQKTGHIQWVFDAGAPCFASAAYGDGVVFVPAEDMTISAIDAKTGRRLWQSEKLPGAGFREQFPVVASGKVVVRTCPYVALAQRRYSYSRADRIPGAKGGFPHWHNFPLGSTDAGREYWANPGRPRKERLAMISARFRQAFQKEPLAQTIHVLDARTGRRAYIAPIIYQEVNTGPPVPPIVGPGGYWYVGTTVTGMGNTCTVAKVNPANGNIEDVLIDCEGGNADGWGSAYRTVMPDGTRSDPSFLPGGFTGDEDNNYAIGGNTLYGRHGHGGWDGIDLTTRITFGKRGGGRPPGGNNAYCGHAISGPYVVGAQICGIATIYCAQGASAAGGAGR